MAGSADLPAEGGVSILLPLLSTMIRHTSSHWILYGILFISMILSDELFR